MDRKTHDLLIGAMEEERIQPILEFYFNTILSKTEECHHMDFKDIDGNYYELKSRGHNFGLYRTTMVSQHKIKFCKANPSVKHYFIFAFKDGDYIYKFDNNDRLIFGLGGREDRGIKEQNIYCYIPINLLIKI